MAETIIPRRFPNGKTSHPIQKQNPERTRSGMKKKKAPERFCVRELARQKGLEPLTYWFVASYSIQLSYCRISFRSR